MIRQISRNAVLWKLYSKQGENAFNCESQCPGSICIFIKENNDKHLTRRTESSFQILIPVAGKSSLRLKSGQNSNSPEVKIALHSISRFCSLPSQQNHIIQSFKLSSKECKHQAVCETTHYLIWSYVAFSANSKNLHTIKEEGILHSVCFQEQQQKRTELENMGRTGIKNQQTNPAGSAEIPQEKGICLFVTYWGHHQYSCSAIPSILCPPLLHCT